MFTEHHKQKAGRYNDVEIRTSVQNMTPLARLSMSEYNTIKLLAVFDITILFILQVRKANSEMQLSSRIDQ